MSIYNPDSVHTTDYHNGNLLLATTTGLAAALLAAVLWAAVASATNIKIGYAAIGVGYAVGWTMRRFGRGHSPLYGYIAAALAVLGCVTGDLLTDCVFVAHAYSTSTFNVISHLTPSAAVSIMQAAFSPLDALFYVIAMVAGYRNAFTRATFTTQRNRPGYP